MALLENFDTRMKPGEAYNRLPDFYKAAAQRGISVSQLLEEEDPSTNSDWAEEDRKVKAFGRVLQASGFVFASDTREGIRATIFEDMYNDEQGRALIPEWTRSIWRRARSSEGYRPQIRPGHAERVIGSDEASWGSTLRPYVDSASVYYQALTPGLSLDRIVAFETAIDGTEYRRPYLVEPSAAQRRLLRIGEKADIPRTEVSLTEHSVRLHKYGRGIELSYEALRRVPVDKVGIFVAQAAIQVEFDRVNQGIDVLLNGDGGGGTSAVVHNQSALDTGTDPTVKGLIAFKSKFKPPYALNLIIAREAELVDLQMMQMPNNNPFLTQVENTLGFGSLIPVQDLNGAVVYYAQSDAVPSGTYLGVDTRYALEHVTEIGSDIQETTRFIERQTEALFFTENDGFSLMDNNANKAWVMA